MKSHGSESIHFMLGHNSFFNIGLLAQIKVVSANTNHPCRAIEKQIPNLFTAPDKTWRHEMEIMAQPVSVGW